MRATTSTRLAGLIGRPVSHSLSPAIHAAAYRELGLDWAYLPFDVGASEVETAVAGAKVLGVVGLSVTMPDKSEAARVADRCSASVATLGAANTLTFEKGEVVADSTDGEGLLADLASALDFDPGGKRCAVIGAGGAARAVVLALARAGAREVTVLNRSADGAARAAKLAPVARVAAEPNELSEVDLVVQATPVHMEGSARQAGTASRGEEWEWICGFDPRTLSRGQLAVDLVYRPAETPWLLAAGEGGARTRGGLGTLVHQAALQVERWSHMSPPLQAMWAAVALPP